MSYLNFHLCFTVPLCALLAFMNWKRREHWSGRSWLGMLALIVLAVSYTIPWDSYLIREGVWSYPPDRVIGTLWRIPYEELFFFVIQTVIGCLLASLVLQSFGERDLREQLPAWSGRLFAALGIIVLALVIWSFSQVMVVSRLRYLALILAWAPPILLLQWAVGHIALRIYWRECCCCIIPLTLYLWCTDAYAISRGIWMFPSGQSTGLFVMPYLPLEEALFFFLTNCMVIQGYILFCRLPVRLWEASNARV